MAATLGHGQHITDTHTPAPRGGNARRLRRSAIYAAVAAGWHFSGWVRLTARAVGWLDTEVMAWIHARVRESRPEVQP